MDGGRCSTCCSRRSAAHVRLKSLQQFQRLSRLTSQERRFGTASECQGAPIKLIRGVEVPGMVPWRGSGPSRRNSNGDPPRRSP
eukprot:1617951-Pyramimonas_sp.AAC.1